MLGGQALAEEPPAGQLPDPGIDDDLIGQRDRHAMLDDPEGRPRADVQVAEAISAVTYEDSNLHAGGKIVFSFSTTSRIFQVPFFTSNRNSRKNAW